MLTAQEVKKAQRYMRSHPTPAERTFRDHFRPLFSNDDYKTQVIVGCYIADNIFVQKMLVVEIDGEDHKRKKVYDHARDNALRAWGFDILRIPNAEVLCNMNAVAARIAAIPDKESAQKLFFSALGHGSADIYKSRQKEKAKRAKAAEPYWNLMDSFHVVSRHCALA